MYILMHTLCTQRCFVASWWTKIQNYENNAKSKIKRAKKQDGKFGEDLSDAQTEINFAKKVNEKSWALFGAAQSKFKIS